jgi:hypothetical protein
MNSEPGRKLAVSSELGIPTEIAVGYLGCGAQTGLCWRMCFHLPGGLVLVVHRRPQFLSLWTENISRFLQHG